MDQVSALEGLDLGDMDRALLRDPLSNFVDAEALASEALHGLIVPQFVTEDDDSNKPGSVSSSQVVRALAVLLRDPVNGDRSVLRQPATDRIHTATDRAKALLGSEMTFFRAFRDEATKKATLV